uniref:Uncharacterized protein n=1 Tax=viral metagenome TaxID=1070528 RepID=A0A6M3L0Q9_9ZZZZ
MEITNISNTPVEFVLSGESFKVIRLSLLDMFASFETDIKTQYMDDVVLYAERIKDPKERMEYQKQAIRDIPRGKSMEELVDHKMNSVEGGIKLLHIALNKCQKVPITKIKELLSDNSNSSTLQNLTAYIMGDDVKKLGEEQKLPEGAVKLEVSEKKT